MPQGHLQKQTANGIGQGIIILGNPPTHEEFKQQQPISLLAAKTVFSLSRGNFVIPIISLSFCP